MAARAERCAHGKGKRTQDSLCVCVCFAWMILCGAKEGMGGLWWAPGFTSIIIAISITIYQSKRAGELAAGVLARLRLASVQTARACAHLFGH